MVLTDLHVAGAAAAVAPFAAVFVMVACTTAAVVASACIMPLERMSVRCKGIALKRGLISLQNRGGAVLHLEREIAKSRTNKAGFRLLQVR